MKEVSDSNLLSSCCVAQVVYTGGIKQSDNLFEFEKAPLYRLCKKCRRVLSVVEEPQNETEKTLLNY